MIFHVLNRGVGRMRLFRSDADYEAFERMLARTRETCPMRIVSYCLMPNHWHLVLWPAADGDLGTFMQKLTITHARNWQEHRHRVGFGHLYQGRYKSFPVQSDEHFYQVVRYVERNALRAGLVRRADKWRWSSLWRRLHSSTEERHILSPWPMPLPRTWAQSVNEPQTEAELAAIRKSLQRGQPFGGQRWVQSTARRLGLQSTLRPRGRPKLEVESS
jgi:putative transposase